MTLHASSHKRARPRPRSNGNKHPHLLQGETRNKNEHKFGKPQPEFQPEARSRVQRLEACAVIFNHTLIARMLGRGHDLRRLRSGGFPHLQLAMALDGVGLAAQNLDPPPVVFSVKADSTSWFQAVLLWMPCNDNAPSPRSRWHPVQTPARPCGLLFWFWGVLSEIFLLCEKAFENKQQAASRSSQTGFLPAATLVLG